jgi:penicillin-binding protein 1C
MDFFQNGFFKFKLLKVSAVLFAAFLLWLSALFVLVRWSKPLFSDPYSDILLDKNGVLLAAQVAEDEQWRFPGNEISEKLKESVLNFEDRYFYSHPGINPISLFRALKANLKSGKIVSGGSTLTMQVARLMRKNKRRTIWEKWIEINWAIGIEFVYSKDEILQMWLNNAPFGGNIVGIEAASIRYFGHGNKELSWAEAATLAVLPNAPSAINPSKNRSALREKRDRVLKLLIENHLLEQTDYELALLEPIPASPKPLPELGRHLLPLLKKTAQNGVIQSSIDAVLQEQIQDLVAQRVQKLSENAIQNAAVILIHVPDMQIRAYVGNLNSGNDEQAPFVDIVQAPRSTGSTLKPLLYALSVDQGLLLPKALIRDIPYRFGDGFNPKNADFSFRGLVHADEALFRSLNVPFVEILSRYGVAPFMQDLRNNGFKSITNSPDYYGLSLILGGSEASLFELTSVYARMAHQLNWTEEKADSVLDIHFTTKRSSSNKKYAKFVTNSSIWATFEAMTKVVRPEEHVFWEEFLSSRKVAWKTGTSFGNKDAWSVGITPDWVVGVWVGNANGEGRPELTGVRSAAPILFDVFSILPTTQWFTMPKDTRLEQICKHSGMQANEYCPETSQEWIPDKTYLTSICTYHKPIYLDKKAQFRVNSSCYSLNEAVREIYFVLNPIEDWYFRKYHSWYKGLPSFLPECTGQKQQTLMQLIYPAEGVTVFIPRDYNGNPGKIILEAVHANPGKKVYWNVNEQFLGITQNVHKISFLPQKGIQKIVLVDEDGFEIRRTITVK